MTEEKYTHKRIELPHSYDGVSAYAAMNRVREYVGIVNSDRTEPFCMQIAAEYDSEKDLFYLNFQTEIPLWLAEEARDISQRVQPEIDSGLRKILAGAVLTGRN